MVTAEGVIFNTSEEAGTLHNAMDKNKVQSSDKFLAKIVKI